MKIVKGKVYRAFVVDGFGDDNLTELTSSLGTRETAIKAIQEHVAESVRKQGSWCTNIILERTYRIMEVEIEVEVDDIPAAVTGGTSATEAFNSLRIARNNYQVRLWSFGANKISVIKAVREITSLGLKDAKEFVERASRYDPQLVVNNVTHAHAIQVAVQIEQAGGQVYVEVMD